MGVDGSVVKQSPLITRLNFNQATEAFPVPDVPPVVEKQQPELIKKTSVAEKVPLFKEIEKTEPEQEIAASPQVVGEQVSPSSDSLLQQKREQYFQRLLSHIESFKFYPRSARKRSIEGNVKISFTLQDSGSYEQLRLDGERSVLVNAARVAIESAVPLPVPADNLKLSRKIEFTMQYALTW